MKQQQQQQQQQQRQQTLLRDQIGEHGFAKAGHPHEFTPPSQPQSPRQPPTTHHNPTTTTTTPPTMVVFRHGTITKSSDCDLSRALALLLLLHYCKHAMSCPPCARRWWTNYYNKRSRLQRQLCVSFTLGPGYPIYIYTVYKTSYAYTPRPSRIVGGSKAPIGKLPIYESDLLLVG